MLIARLAATEASVRATVTHMSALCAPVTRALRPFKTHVDPSAMALVEMAARSLPAPGSV